MFLKKFDLLHIPISLSYNNEYFYNTKFGAVLSLLCFIIIMSLGAYEMKTLLDKSSFSIISNKYSDLNQIIDFSKIPLLFQLIDNAGRIIEIDDKLYEFKAYDMDWIVRKDENGKKENKVINTKLEMDYCNKVYTNSNLTYLSSFNLSQYFCIKSNQNLTSHGYFGDLNNGFKGFRIYLNKCNGKKNCYNDSYIINKLKNIKFAVTYLGLNIDIFKSGEKDIHYEMLTNACSVSTNILKKFYFSFSIGKYILLDNIFIRRKKVINYIIGNSPTTDFDLDPSSTIQKNSNTLAYFSFNFDGNIVEINKEVKKLYDTISIVGNAFNIILTLIKIINNYYSNKILFADIFRAIFFKEGNKNININIKKYKDSPIHSHNNKNNNSNNKKNIDLSDEIVLNNNVNELNININKKTNKVYENSDKNKAKRKLSQIFTINQDDFTDNKLIYFYLFPFWVLKKRKAFNSIYLIKAKICNYFSIEKLNELIKFKDVYEDTNKKYKENNNTEFIYNKNNIECNLDKNFQNNNDSNEMKSKSNS